MTSVAMIVNGGFASAMGHRARAFARHLAGTYDLRLLYRSGGKGPALARFLAELAAFRPRVCYVLDMAAAGVGAAGLYKYLTRNRLIIDTGDAIGALARSLGRSALGVRLTEHLEEYGLRAADHMVVRGTNHRRWLAERGIDATFIPDGVDVDLFAPAPAFCARQPYGPDRPLTVGLVGSSVWSDKLQACYGWDLIELVRLLRDQPVSGIIIGAGSGIPVLHARCREYGIESRVQFLGHLPHEQLPHQLHRMDVCLSTQSNDLVGQVRTTGKLPLYMACGRYVLASRVGEAARLLPDEMLVDYQGTMDRAYPQKLADRVFALLRRPECLDTGRRLVEMARTHFDYPMLARRVGSVIEGILAGRPRNIVHLTTHAGLRKHVDHPSNECIGARAAGTPRGLP
jgi:glycosyltransferase involved in cell wall biosynthesis